jgi:septal ring factor EnvC (AmiA/AmiB activator)
MSPSGWNRPFLFELHETLDMARTPLEEEKIGRLRRQRNLFATLAVCSVASIGFAFPRKIAAIREQKAVNAQLVELQTEIVQNQQQTRDVEKQILAVEQEIKKREAQ